MSRANLTSLSILLEKTGKHQFFLKMLTIFPQEMLFSVHMVAYCMYAEFLEVWVLEGIKDNREKLR